MAADKLIEAMAIAICMERDQEAFEDVVTSQYDRDLATAAYAAMRDALVPVGYHHVHKETGNTGLTRFPNQSPEGWTEMPLYALPEIKP